MSFRMGKTECKLVRSILAAHGFREVCELHLSSSNLHACAFLIKQYNLAPVTSSDALHYRW